MSGSRRVMGRWARYLEDELRDLETRALRRSVVTPETGPEPRVMLDGREYRLFTSNNYLGLATHPAVIEAAVGATRRYGAGASASRLLCGSTPLHGDLEKRLAAMKGQEACLLYSSGYLANLGALSALAGPEDAVFSDELNHASIIDGCRLSRARPVVYRHLDLDHLEACMRETPSRRRIIVSETVFSMDGDIAPLPGLAEVAARHDALLMLDEAHATGVLGEGGRGAVSHFGALPPAEMAVVGTLSKALGAAGGFVAGSRSLVEYLLNRSRPFIFSTALPPAAAGAALAAVGLLASEPWRRERVLALAEVLREGFASQGYPRPASATPIVPLMIGEARTALEVEARLREAGILARAIRPPTVPEGTCRIRFNVMATHEEDDIRLAVEAVAGG